MGGKSGSKKRTSRSKDSAQANSSDNFTVERIVADRIIKGKTQYKVHWAGYSTEEETWENESQLDCPELLDEYLAESDADTGKSSSKAAGGRRGGQETQRRSAKKNDSYAEGEADSEGESSGSGATPSGSSSSKKSSARSQPPPQQPPAEFSVEKIVADRKKNGKTQYLVHWEGYTTEEESWENASQLDCNELIEEYLANKPSTEEQDKEKKVSKKRPANKKAASASSDSKKSKPGPVNGDNEYEVERIIEMHTSKHGTREFLVRWKGFGKEGDTWEPESHLNGTQLLEKFLQKVEKAKEIPAKELRMHRKPTDRFTAMPQGDKRRQSKRHAQHQRVKYYDAE